MKYLPRIIVSFSLLLICSCSSGFDSKKANQLLEKENLTTEDYTEMIQIYENGLDDAIRFSQENPGQLSTKQKEEFMLVFAIGMRLSKDDAKLTEEQRKELERINLKGKEGATQEK